MMNAKGYLFCFVLGLVIGAGVCGAVVYRAGAARIGQLGGQLDEAIRDNQQLGIELDNAKALVGQLGAELDRNAGFISSARAELESSKSSVAKIRAILEALRDLERSAGGNSGSSPAP